MKWFHQDVCFISQCKRFSFNIKLSINVFVMVWNITYYTLLVSTICHFASILLDDGPQRSVSNLLIWFPNKSNCMIFLQAELTLQPVTLVLMFKFTILGYPLERLSFYIHFLFKVVFLTQQKTAKALSYFKSKNWAFCASLFG